MIKFVTQEKPFKDDIGDWVSSHAKCFVDPKTHVDYKHIVPLTWASGLLRAALSELDISVASFDEAIPCPYSGLPYYPLVVMAVLSNDPLHYQLLDNLKKTHIPWMVDTEWNKRDELIDDMQSSRIYNAMLGSGYSYGRSSYDGHGRVVPVIIKLSNGDALYCLTWVWFNK